MDKSESLLSVEVRMLLDKTLRAWDVLHFVLKPYCELFDYFLLFSKYCIRWVFIADSNILERTVSWEIGL